MWSRTSIHGSPGRSARRLALRRTILGWTALAVGVVMGAALVVSGWPTVGLGTLGAGWAMHRASRTRAARAHAGAAAEHDAAARLRRVRAAAVAYDVRLPGLHSDVDAIVLGPMAAAVEIKRAYGRVRCYGDGTVRAGRNALPGRPLAQAIAQAAAVRRTVGNVDHVDAVLCVVGMRQRPRLVDVNGVDVWVTSLRHLRRVLRRLPNRIARDDAKRAAAELQLAPP